MRGRFRQCVAVTGALCLAIGVVSIAAHADETTIGYDVTRSAWDGAEPNLAPAKVTAPDFGTLFDTTLPRPAGQTAVTYPNQIYAQPLVVTYDTASNAKEVVVATDENQVDAVDPASGALLWSQSFGPAFSSPAGCGDLTPHIGITSTPVFDPSTNTIYLVSKSDDGPDSAHPNVRLHALNPVDGTERAGWPVVIGGSATNSGLAFNSATAGQRAGLMLLNGVVYVAFASHCDQEPYVGYIASVSTTARTVKLWSSESKLGTDKAGIWMSGGGLVSDGPGRIFVATGNGVSPAPGPGTTPPGTLAESVVRLAVNSDTSLTAKDFFSPADNTVLDQNDTDFGSGSPVALPNSYGTASVPHVLVQVGKDGTVFLLNRDNLGGNRQGPGGTDKVVSSLQLPSGVWGRPAIFDTGASHYIYLVPSTAAMQVLRVAPNASGVPTLSLVGSSGTFSFPYTSGSPVVTSTANDPATALVWVAQSGTGSSGQNSKLVAFPAIPPSSGPWNPVFSASLGTIAKFISPATDGGRVYVGTRDGRVLGFGSPVQSAINAPATEFGTQAVGTTSTPQTVTVAVQAAVTVNGVSSGAAFGVGSPSVTLPHAFAAGDSFTVPVTFAPTVAGSTSGLLDFTTSSGEYNFSPHGTGTQPGLSASPLQVAFGQVSVGAGRQLGVTITNTGTSSATIQSVTLPAAPFAVSGLPAQGAVIAAQQSVTATILFSPTAATTYNDQIVLTADTGSVTVPLSGSGISGAPHMAFDVSTLSFGQVQPGATKSMPFVITNTGFSPLTITKAAVPSSPFIVPSPISEGQTLQPGDSLTVTVTFTPKTAQTAKDVYLITSNDGLGAKQVALNGNTSGWTGAIAGLLCLDDRGGHLANGAVVDGYTCNGSAAEQWSWGPGYTIRAGAPNSPWCLDVKNAGTADQTPVQMYGCNNSVAQRWTWRADNSLWNPNSGKCLDLRSTTLGQPMRIFDCLHTSGQYWDLTPLFSTRGITSAGVATANTICMTDRGGSKTNGAIVEIDPCIQSAAQMLTHSGGTMRFSSVCLAAAANTVHAKVWLWRCAVSTTQQWIWNSSNGTLKNVWSGLCVNVPGGVTKPGTGLELNTCSTAISERWRLPG